MSTLAQQFKWKVEDVLAENEWFDGEEEIGQMSVNRIAKKYFHGKGWFRNRDNTIHFNDGSSVTRWGVSVKLND